MRRSIYYIYVYIYNIYIYIYIYHIYMYISLRRLNDICMHVNILVMLFIWLLYI